MSTDQGLASTQDSSHLQHQHVELSANNQAACPGFLSRVTVQIISGDENQRDKWRWLWQSYAQTYQRAAGVEGSLAPGVCSELWHFRGTPQGGALILSKFSDTVPTSGTGTDLKWAENSKESNSLQPRKNSWGLINLWHNITWYKPMSLFKIFFLIL